ncbi:uncharacterized protein TNCT_284141 [Trichonephila clavata]|uniref:Uncharacterized protein n=1 Tax=Trichonephila clavata TaxID=2740835 RepID=A0A8X6H0T8_TRICU|nr:uncharacterized protein TNCT_284141 [Trichonephila clavata]
MPTTDDCRSLVILCSRNDFFCVVSIHVSRTLVDVGGGNRNSVTSRMDCMEYIQENKTKMIKYLQKLWLPNDELIAHIRKNHHLDPSLFPRYTTPKPFERRITLDIVQNKYVVEAAKEYIEHLLKNKEEYGYLYHLMKQNLYIQFDVKFNGELAIECARYDQVVEAIDELAREWACKNSLMYEVTRLKLFYFFILLMNPEINWTTVDFLLQGTKGHARLIAARAKQLSEKLIHKKKKKNFFSTYGAECLDSLEFPSRKLFTTFASSGPMLKVISSSLNMIRFPFCFRLAFESIFVSKQILCLASVRAI